MLSNMVQYKSQVFALSKIVRGALGRERPNTNPWGGGGALSKTVTINIAWGARGDFVEHGIMQSSGALSSKLKYNSPRWGGVLCRKRSSANPRSRFAEHGKYRFSLPHHLFTQKEHGKHVA